MKQFFKKIIPEKYKGYLPSKKFITITGSCLILATAIFVIFFTSSSGENFTVSGKEINTSLKVENRTIADLIANDTDSDGIPDWEEALWGTDKNKKITFNDTPDATYIENKKKELKIEQTVSINEQNLTETEKFAREFFATYTAMKSSGQVDNDTINSFSNALGQKIINPEMIDRYKEADVKIDTSDDSANKQIYYENVKKVFKKYQREGIGDELDIISRGLSLQSVNGAVNTDQYAKLAIIANAYKDFAKGIMNIDVPQSLVAYHLRIANDSNNTGISVSNMEKIVSDPIVGLSGLSQYQKYSNDLINSVADLETFLLNQI